MATKKAKIAAQIAEIETPVKTKDSSRDSSGISAADFQRLRKMHLWLALVFGVQAVALLLFGGSKSLPVTLSYLGVDQLGSDVAGHQVVATATHHLFDMRISLVAARFLIILAVACVVIATIGRPYYETQLRRGSHLARWLTFGLGGGFMVMSLAMISGVSDITVLAMMLLLTLLGFGLEPLAVRLKQQGKGVAAHAVCTAAVVAAIAPWLALALGVLGAFLWDGHIPGTTFAMYATTALFFSCWALAAHFRSRSMGKWASTLYTERMYLFLTLAAPTILAWQLFAGAF